LDLVLANSKHKAGQSDTDLNDGSNVDDRYPVRLSGLDRYDVRTCVPRPREKSPILSARIDPVSFDDRMPQFLKPDVQPIDVETHLAELEWERQDAGGLSTEMCGGGRIRRHSFFPGLVLRTGAAMAVAALIAGMLVFKPDLKELGLLTSELKNGFARIMTTVFEATNNIAGAFAAIPIAAPTKQESTSDPERSGAAVAQLKRHASTLLPKGVVNSYAMVSPGKTDSQEPAVDVRDSPPAIDQVKLTTITPPDTAAPAVPAAPPRRLDADELAALIKRAKSLIAVSDIAPARLLLERAADAQEPSAALLLAKTYEPAVGTQDIRGITPDSAMARSWYEKAVRFGSTEAQQRLAKMRN
jgi:hypothetical protein